MRQWLPRGEDEGNVITADGFARQLRLMFAADLNALNSDFGSALKVILENFQGLRVYYQEIGKHYDDIRSGALQEPFPLDAADGFLRVIAENTPATFDPSVKQAGGDVTAEPPEVRPPDEPATPSTPAPPPDPLGDVDPHKARDKEAGAFANAVMKGIEIAEKAPKGVEGLAKVKDQLEPFWRPIWEWLAGPGA